MTSPELSTLARDRQIRKVLAEPSARAQEASRANLQKILADYDALRSRNTGRLPRLNLDDLDIQRRLPARSTRLRGPLPEIRPGIRRSLAKPRTGALARVLLDPGAVARDAVLTSRVATDPASVATGYAILHARAVARSQNLSADGRRRLSALASPVRAKSMNLRDLQGLRETLSDLLVGSGRLPGKGSAPRGYPANCGAETGAGTGGDLETETRRTPSAQGLWAQCDWPLKYFTTCVKDQGNRGTCSAFGTIAAVEALIAREEGRWVNLSEQDLYKMQRFDWFPAPYYYDDGYSPPISLIGQLLTGYVFPYERDWDYNKSLQRVDDAENLLYRRSCVGYNGRACSNTNHQARAVEKIVETRTVKTVVEEVCSWVEGIPVIGGFLGEYVCEPVEKVIEVVDRYVVTVYDTDVPGTSGYRVTGRDILWNPVGPAIDNGQIASARAYLAVGVPLVFCFGVVPSWYEATSRNGFIPYRASETVDGGHCVMASGYIDNADLPTGVAPGRGGGYFILKNSWGTGYGDAGYCYAPVDWVKEYGTVFCAITDIAR